MQDVAQQDPIEGTEVRKFLARRGAIAIKETRDLGVVPGLYTDDLLVSTMVLAIVKGAQREMSYSVKLERRDDQKNTTASVLLDYDELPELIEAFDFIASHALEMQGRQRDYTEVTYSTKDAARFGFFQSRGQQQIFVAPELHGDLIFLADHDFPRLKSLLGQAKSHLESKGASLV
ncbi:hypothetical protein [Acidovorax temperans]|uniref:hypothetical protein n=1 Tax=Acidovorax temperans TaxID=80878 RepID=UPI0030CE6219